MAANWVRLSSDPFWVPQRRNRVYMLGRRKTCLGADEAFVRGLLATLEKLKCPLGKHFGLEDAVDMSSRRQAINEREQEVLDAAVRKHQYLAATRSYV